jgi:hypothetical protein
MLPMSGTAAPGIRKSKSNPEKAVQASGRVYFSPDIWGRRTARLRQRFFTGSNSFEDVGSPARPFKGQKRLTKSGI